MARDPTSRALALLSLLQSGVEHSAADLARRLGVSERTVRRDASRLRDLGYDVASRPGPGSGYRLVPGVRIPPLLFEDDEVTALVTGLRWLQARVPDDDAAARALRKLGDVLPPGLRRRADATALSLEVLDGAGPGSALRDVGIVAQTVADGGRVRFSYRDQHDRASMRHVEPYRHVLRDGRWYLVAFDLDRDDWRLFRFDRISEVDTAPGQAARRDPPAETLEAWFASDFGRR